MTDPATQPQPSDAYVPPVVDEARDLDIGPLDIVLGILTLPLLFWALMYAVSGSEKIVATRAARYKLYAVLLAIEVVIVLAVVAAVTR